MASSHVPIATATVIEPGYMASAVVEPDIAPPNNGFNVSSRPSYIRVGQSSRVLLPPGSAAFQTLSDSNVRSLKDQGFTTGLCHSLARNSAVHVLRIWIVDNSGSMNTSDGHRIVETSRKDDVKVVSCTRWKEIQECVEYHIQLAALLEAPTVFRMLNDPGRIAGPQQFSIGERGTDFIGEDVALALQTIHNSSPGGVTPLAQHVREIRDNLKSMEADLHREGTKVVIVLATDGLPTDDRGFGGPAAQREFVEALRSLEGLPVWIVVRLCTDEEDVVGFYNDLDSQLELSLEVLDDFLGEAQEVYEKNGWLNYALPLHRIREMGFYSRLFDLLDEKRLSKDELRDFLLILFGDRNFDGVPDPEVDWKGFVEAIDKLQRSEKQQWNPITKKMGPWIDLKKLNKDYQKSKTCTIM